MSSKLQLSGIAWTAAELDHLEDVAAGMTSSESVAMGLNIANISTTHDDRLRAQRVGQHNLAVAHELGLEVSAAKLRAGLSSVLPREGDSEADHVGSGSAT